METNIKWVYTPKPDKTFEYKDWRECKLILGTNRARRLVKEGKLVRID